MAFKETERSRLFHNPPQGLERAVEFFSPINVMIILLASSFLISSSQPPFIFQLLFEFRYLK